MFANNLDGRSPFSICGWQIRLFIASILLAIGMPCAMATDVPKSATLAGGSVLRVGEALISPSHEFFLTTQSDGNFCVYHEFDGTNVWCSRSSSAGEGNYVTGMQTDGNVCTSRTDGYIAWCLNPARYDGPFFLALQDDANVCVYRGVPDGIIGTVWCSMALAQPHPHGPPIHYGESYFLQNAYNNWSGGYLDVRGGPCMYNPLCVSTAAVENRDTNSGTWVIASAEGKPKGAPVMRGEMVYLKNKYPLDKDGISSSDRFGGYLDVRGGGCEGNLLCVSTSLKANTGPDTSVWKFVADRHSLYVGQSLHLQNQYPAPSGFAYLDVRGGGCSGNLLCVSASLNPNRDNGSGSWRVLNSAPFSVKSLLSWTAGTSTPVAGCDDKSRCFWLKLANSSSNTATFTVKGIASPGHGCVGMGCEFEGIASYACYQGNEGTYKIPTGQERMIGIARVQGHGCDGLQGAFKVTIQTDGNSDSVTFLNFSNDAILAFNNTNPNPTYDLSLSLRSQTTDGWFIYNMALNGKWKNPPVCDSARCFQLYLTNALATPITWRLNPGTCYEGTSPGQFTVQPNERYQIALARVQGHGCDGHQGEFNLQPVDSFGGEAQSFSFTDDGALGLSNAPQSYLSLLSPKDRNNSYTYTVDENFTHVASIAATTTGNWSNPSIKLLNFTTTEFWPNFYEECGGVELYHNQHVVRLPNDGAGNAYFMVAQSRAYNGYITLLKVDKSMVDPITDSISGADKAVVGKAVWQQVYTGVQNGNMNPVGNWNHPGKMSYMDGILAVAAQNWYPMAICGSTVGDSDDKVLFYDVRNMGAPRYLGALTAGELGVPNHELGTVELAYDALAGKYLLVAGGNKVYPVLAANVFNPSIANWTTVPGGPSFSGQHGLAFDVVEGGIRKLVYFDAKRENESWLSSTSGTFSFTTFEYSSAPPYLAGGSKQDFRMTLPGANRDWDASSVYISPITRRPIVYTVKSVGGDNYQLYQVMPTN